MSSPETSRPQPIDELDSRFRADAEEMLMHGSMESPGANLFAVYRFAQRAQRAGAEHFSDKILFTIDKSKERVAKAASGDGRQLINEYVGEYFTGQDVHLKEDEEPVDRLLSLEPEQYAEFAAWHVLKFTEDSRRLHEAWPQLQADFLDSYETCVRLGKLPKIAEEILASRLANNNLEAADVFDASAYRNEPFAGRYQRHGAISNTVIAAQYADRPKDLKKVAFHELRHLVSGHEHTIGPDPDYPGEVTISTPRIGLREGDRYSWANEAATEHETQMLLAASKDQDLGGLEDILALLPESSRDSLIPDFNGKAMRDLAYKGAYRPEREGTGILILPKALGALTLRAFDATVRPDQPQTKRPFTAWKRGFDKYYGDDALISVDDFVKANGVTELNEELQEREASANPHWQSLAKDLRNHAK